MVSKISQLAMKLSVATLGVAFLSGCVLNRPVSPFVPPLGGIFSKVSMPMNPEATEVSVDFSRNGSSSAISILSLVAVGSVSQSKAAREGRIEEIAFADIEYTNIFGVYSKYTVTVYPPLVTQETVE